MNENSVKDIIKTRHVIRKKYELLMSNQLEDSARLQQIFSRTYNENQDCNEANTHQITSYTVTHTCSSLGEVCCEEPKMN